MTSAIIAGVVVGPDGRPIAGASVMFSQSPVAVPDIAQMTGADGGFSLAAPAPGRYRIAVRAPDAAVKEVDVRVKGKKQAPLKVVVETPHQ